MPDETVARVARRGHRRAQTALARRDEVVDLIARAVVAGSTSFCTVRPVPPSRR